LIMAADRLLILAESPRQSELDDGLMPPLAKDDALEVYDACLHDVIALAARERGRVELWCKGRRERGYFERHFPHLTCRLQSDGEPIARMREAFELSFADGGERVVIMRHDAPTLPDTILTSAFHDLQDADAVAGPLPDGGCYLIGIRSRAWPGAANLFRSVHWSAPQAMSEMIANAAATGLDLRVLPGWYRIATTEDLVRARADAASDSRLGQWLSSAATRGVLPA
jgi:glycosyltransferase A (GT-A) superfamily protein (DUF2064 family)